jgi:FKBP-type peptidyl-prolyl cis-trans isomerase
MRMLVAASALVLVTTAARAGDPGEASKTSRQALPVNPVVKVETTAGDLTMELDAKAAPLTVANFIEYVDDGYYDGTAFHRVVKGLLIQGGLYLPNMGKKTEGLRDPIRNEWRNGLSHVYGSVAMSRPTGKPDGARSEFFINLARDYAFDYPQRDGAGFAVFGVVVEGMQTAERIAGMQVMRHPNYEDRGEAVVPINPPVIKSIRVIREFDRDALAARVQALEDRHAAKADKVDAETTKKIEDYVRKVEAQTGKKFVRTPSGLRYLVLAPGSGPQPRRAEHVHVHFVGSVLGGNEFMSTRDSGPKTYPVESNMRGWSEAMQLMSAGAKWKLVVPPDLAYGSAGRPAIPPNSVLLFDVELLEILPQQ